ncbi:peroxisome biogenesis factor 1 [Necator americanus]|uniref:Peroxisome biogenesis factor 1 n=1 Tax=Necator americanus TaxID=51031 RepID=W2TBQ3_NECAM|nr:peroxisome biogenesis factor 1 [Necator americanus]ETN78626.1 peroxisome biogenesis factor 1 [Necator americanus]
MSCPVFLIFHDLPNCFAYAKSCSYYCEDVTPSITGVLNTFLGYFRVRSCETPHRELYVQVFGIFPTSHILVNRTFAALAGFRSNEEVVIETVATLTSSCVYIAPTSQNDYEICVSDDARSSAHVEYIFLQQIRIVFPGLLFPLWISPNVYASFRVGMSTIHLTCFCRVCFL